MVNREALRHKKAGRVLEVNLVDDRYFSIRCGDHPAGPLQRIGLFKAEHKHAPCIRPRILQPTGPRQRLGE